MAGGRHAEEDQPGEPREARGGEAHRRGRRAAGGDHPRGESEPRHEGGPSKRRRGPTIVDVARHAGVSTAAVSFALNGRPGVAAETRERIHEVARELGWEPSASARSLGGRKEHALGLVIARDPTVLSADPFFPAFIAGVELELATRGQSLLLSMVGDDPQQELERYRHLARSERVDGVIVTDLRFDDPRIALLEQLHLKAVTLNRPDVPSPFPAVCQDDAPGVREAVEHLAGLGHTRIAYVAGRADMLHGAHRRDAWAAAMREHRLTPDLVHTTDFTAAAGANATRALLQSTDRPTAIVYANDTMAIAGLTVAHELGIVPPRDLSIVGYEDSELAAHVYPSLTSVRSDPLQWGRTATRVLLDAIDGDANDVELEPARLVVRASTQERRRS
jgi:DNA-binding LacI/PurR family transcriptional regulator